MPHQENRIVRMRLVMSASVLALFAATAGAGHAATLYVANNGVDGAGCGTRLAPCRSIRQAIGLASDGDRIIIGPGRYGDLNGDGAFDGLAKKRLRSAPAAGA